MRKLVVVLALALLILLFLGGYVYLMGKQQPVNCSTFVTGASGANPYYGCDVEHDFGDGLVLKVVNLRNYVFVLNRYLFLNLAQVKDGRVLNHWYLARVFEGSDGLLLIIRPSNITISTDANEQRLFLSIADFKNWLDTNQFKDKQVVASFYTKPGEILQYFIGMAVYQGDVKKN